MDKVPPQNIEAERAVIGSVLIDDKVMLNIQHVLKPDFFYDPRHGLLFEHIEKLYRANKPIDALTLTDELKKSKKVRQSGGGAYLSEIIASVPTAANVEEYANIVKEKAVRRNLVSFSGVLGELARDEEKKLDEIVDEVEKNLVGVAQDNAKVDFLTSAELLEAQMARADEYAKNPNALRGIPSGVGNLDKILGGLHKSDLLVLAARPGVGKSAFALYMARHIAVNEGKSVAIFSLEMPGIQLIERMLAQETGISLWNLRMGKLEDDEFQRCAVAQGKLSEAQIFVDETSGINIMQLRSKARKLMIEHGLDFLVIDYLQLMQGRSTDNRAQEVGEISRSLKILARELNVPVLALSQLNRAVENRVDGTPQLSDLRESGSIEQDADVVMFLNRNMGTGEESDMNEIEKKVDLIVAKHRNGAIGRTKLMFHAPSQSYEDIESTYAG